MKKQILMLGILILVGCSDDTTTSPQILPSNEIAFVLTEGSFQSNDAALWMISDSLVTESLYNPTGDTGQSMAIHNNKLYLVNNGSSNLIIYSIENDGTISQSSVIDLNSSSPREIIIVNNTAYISQWASKSIAAINLTSLAVNQIAVPGCSEGLATDGDNLYAAIKYEDIASWPYVAGNTIEKIELSSSTIVQSIPVSNNPDKVLFNESYLYVSSQYGDWPTYSYITDKVDINSGSVVATKDHGSDVSFGSDFALYNGNIYRSYQNGIISLNSDLSVNTSNYIGASNLTGLYSMAINENLIYLGFSDYSAPDNVLVMNFNGETVYNFEVGASPGSIAFWSSE